MLHHIFHSAGWYNISTKNAHDPCPPGGRCQQGTEKMAMEAYQKSIWSLAYGSDFTAPGHSTNGVYCYTLFGGEQCHPGGDYLFCGYRSEDDGSLMKQLVLGYFWTTTRLSGSGYVGFCLPFAGVAGPTCGVHPFGIVTGGVDVEGDEDDVWHEIPGQAGDDGEMASVWMW